MIELRFQQESWLTLRKFERRVREILAEIAVVEQTSKRSLLKISKH